jgi:ribonuclease P protein component
MPGAPRAASASLSDSGPSGRRAWRKRQRLLRAPEFASFSLPQASWRATRRWIAMSVLMQPQSLEPVACAASAAAPVRFGLTVSRRQAPRAAARNLVKRILRESARHAAGGLEAAAGSRRVDVLLRLKAPLPERGASGLPAIKVQLRREADSLMEQLARHLRSPSYIPERAQSPGPAGAPAGDPREA